MNDRLKRVLAANPETTAPALLAALVVADAIDGLRVNKPEEQRDPLENFAQTIAETMRAAVKRPAA